MSEIRQLSAVNERAHKEIRTNKKPPIERFLEWEKLMIVAAWPDENLLHALRRKQPTQKEAWLNL